MNADLELWQIKTLMSLHLVTSLQVLYLVGYAERSVNKNARVFRIRVSEVQVLIRESFM